MSAPGPIAKLVAQASSNPTLGLGLPTVGGEAPSSVDLSKITTAEARFIGFYISQSDDAKSVSEAKEHAGIHDPEWEPTDSPEVIKCLAFHEATRSLISSVVGTKEFLAWKAYEIYEIAMEGGKLKEAIAALNAINDFTRASEQVKGPDERTIRWNLSVDKSKKARSRKESAPIDGELVEISPAVEEFAVELLTKRPKQDAPGDIGEL